jgi:hypothetical protein
MWISRPLERELQTLRDGEAPAFTAGRVVVPTSKDGRAPD